MVHFTPGDKVFKGNWVLEMQKKSGPLASSCAEMVVLGFLVPFPAVVSIP